MLEPKTDTAFRVEAHGIDVIPEKEHHGRPSELFWVWFAANLVFLGTVIGGILMTFGISVSEALIIDLVGSASFILVGLAAVPGARTGTATLVLSRATFGVKGNILPTFLSWLTLVGWEIVSLVTGTYALVELFGVFGAHGGTTLDVIALLIIAGSTFSIPLLGHQTIVVVQRTVSYVFGAVALVVLIFMLTHYRVQHIIPKPVTGNGVTTFLLGLSLVVAVSAYSWVNYASDYSRYLPSGTSAKPIVFWTAAGLAVPSVILIGTGILIGGQINIAGAANPIQALVSLLPNWLVVPFLLTAIVGFVTSNFMNSYSSGLNLQTLFIKQPRYKTVLIDGIIALAMSLYAVLAVNFVGFFESFLSLMAIWLSSWSGVFLVDVRRRLKTGGYKTLGLSSWGFGPYWYNNGVQWGGIVSWLLGCLAAFTFTDSSLWESPVDKALLGGGDISVFMGLGVGALSYWVYINFIQRTSLNESADQAVEQVTMEGEG